MSSIEGRPVSEAGPIYESWRRASASCHTKIRTTLFRAAACMLLGLLGAFRVAPASAITFDANTRVRYESVDDERYANTADALTWRVHSGFRTAPRWNTSLIAGAEFVGHLGTARFNDGIHGRSQYPDVGDPDAEELDELYLFHQTDGPTGRLQAWIGRRGWFQDRQRFFGGGRAWRQNAQSWDAAGLQWSDDAWTFEWVQVGKVRRPSGNHSPKGRQELDGRIARLTWSANPDLSGSVYSHWLDYGPGPAIPDTASNRTLGASADVSRTFGSLRLALHAETANQKGWRTHVPSSEGHYRNIEVAAVVGTWRLSLMQEVLSGDGHTAFQTPVAGLHAFNGHADRFLKTPVQGLDDRAVALGWISGRWSVQTAQHWYASSVESLDYGTETDASVSYTARHGHRLQAKAALYNGSDSTEVSQTSPMHGASVNKIWLLWDWTW